MVLLKGKFAAAVVGLLGSLLLGATAKAEQTELDPATIRQEMRIEPLPAASPQQIYAPGTSAGIPSAFGANWGDVYVGLSGATADDLRPEIDGGLTAGIGLGNSREAVGLELSYNILSIRRFAQNGSFDAKVHRTVYSDRNTQIAAAVGWNNFARYGSDTAGTSSSVYGLVTGYHFLQPDDPVNPLPINLSLGVGGAPLFTNSDSGVGVIAGAGMQVHPNIGVSTAWSGRGLNLAGSYLPVRTLPLTLNVVYGDALNNTPAGSVLVFSVGYGFNFTPNF